MSSYGKLALWCVLTIAMPVMVFAQGNVESRKLPKNYFKQTILRTIHGGDPIAEFGKTKMFAGHGKATAAKTGLSDVDSVENWSDQFITPGFDFTGKPQSVWPYTMVGTPPESGITTRIHAPIIPVTVDLLGDDGKVAVYQGHTLTFVVTPKIVKAIVNSPVFESFAYPSGTGQFNDVMMRTQFWNRIHHSNGDQEGDNNDDYDNSDREWHIKLQPSVKTTRRMQIPNGFWYFAIDANNVPIAAVVEGSVFSGLLFPQKLPVDSSTPIGAAELAGEMTTRDISTLIFNNVFLYQGDIAYCCAAGYHSVDVEPGDAHNGNRERRYVMNYSSWLANGFFAFGFEDITAHSHEMAEIFNDPFLVNETPWWLNVDPIIGGGICQDNLEVGDVVEVLTANPVYAVSMDGRTYHPQNEAMFPWFAFESPSPARNKSYSFPDETTLTTLSPANILPCTRVP